MSNKDTNTTTYTYFVSYHYTSSTGFSVGNTDVTTAYPLATMAAIRHLEAGLRNHFSAPSIVLLGFSPIEHS